MKDDKLKELASELARNYELAYEIAKVNVDDIINNKITDTDYIEHTLDYCFNIYTEKGFDLFLKLVFYYSTFNLEGSYVYISLLKKDRTEEYNQYVKRLEKKK